MRKKILVSMLGVFAFCLYFACTDDKISDYRDKGVNTFSKENAKKLFETRATNLRSLSFEKEPNTRSLEINTPEWDKAETYVTDQSVIVEVPIFSPGSTRVYQREHRKTSENNRITMAFKKLIIAQRNGGNKEMFVVTFVPDCLTPRFVHNMKENLRYYGGTFSGLLFCSDLDGRFRAGFRYIDGVNKGHLEFTFREKDEERKLEEGEVSFRMQNFVAARSFGDDESFAGSGSLCQHGQDPFTCPQCTSIPEVVVKFCRKCKTQTTGNEPCLCCPWCNEYPCKCPCPWCGFYPCKCDERCSECGKIPCVHPCEYCKMLYCHGQCRGGGGGGSDTGVPPDPSDTTNIDDGKLTVDNFMRKVFTPEFLKKVLTNLGVDAKNIPITFEERDATNLGAYNHKTKSININPKIFDQDYNKWDIISVTYHELVHAKQDIIDHRVAEYDENEEVIEKEYVFPCDDYYVAQGWDEFYSLVDVLGLPRNESERNEQQKAQWNYYYQNYVGKREEEKRLGKTYTEKANYIYSKNEMEAHDLQLKEYLPYMSQEYRDKMLKNLEQYSRVVRVIENQ